MGEQDSNKSRAVIRLTERLALGHELTAATAAKHLGLDVDAHEKVGRWLKAVSQALGDRVGSHYTNGHTLVYTHQSTHSMADQDVEDALMGVRFAEGLLRPLERARPVRALREAAERLSRQLGKVRYPRMHRRLDLILRPDRPSGRPDLSPLVDELIDAMLHERIIGFAYQAIGGEVRRYRLKPWSLVDHAGGLYLFGEKVSPAGERRTFDLEQIRGKLEVEEEGGFTRPDNCQDLFEDYRAHRCGIWVTKSPPVEVWLEVRGYARQYLQRRPLATKQTISEPPSSTGWARVDAFVAIDPELIGRLLMLAPEVKVLGPRTLVTQYRAALTAATERNSSD